MARFSKLGSEERTARRDDPFQTGDAPAFRYSTLENLLAAAQEAAEARERAEAASPTRLPFARRNSPSAA